MTDFAPHDQWLVGNDFTDYFFVAHDKMKQYLISKDIPDGKIYVTGIPISDKFSTDLNKSEILKKYNLSEDKQTILL
jgi:processive 1,2-diacylglycerol beta-glucosyltransferase